jgi:hypothetical protein
MAAIGKGSGNCRLWQLWGAAVRPDDLPGRLQPAS